MSIRVCIADDHLLVLDGIRRALDDADGIEVVAATQRGDEVAALVESHRPDLVLVDHRMPDLDGIAVLKLIKARHPEIKVVMLSASEAPAVIGPALAAGASAFIGKRINPDDLASALRQVVGGVVYRTGRQLDEADQRPSELTQRELTILEAIAAGLSTKAISRKLWISEKTVKFHLTNIYRKLGVHNRTGAMRYAFEHGILPAPQVADGAAATG